MGLQLGQAGRKAPRKPLVGVNAFNKSGRQSVGPAPHCRPYHRVIVLDYRGTGQSDKPNEPAYSTRGFAQDAVAVLELLGIERAHAYGVSMGGRVAQ